VRCAHAAQAVEHTPLVEGSVILVTEFRSVKPSKGFTLSPRRFRQANSPLCESARMIPQGEELCQGNHSLRLACQRARWTFGHPLAEGR
jgi:hypothetical protein